MSMWLQDIEKISADELEGLCEELEMKLDEGRKELIRKEEAADDVDYEGELVTDYPPVLVYHTSDMSDEQAKAIQDFVEESMA